MKYLYYYCFFIFIILLFAYINSYSSKKESFTPEVRGFYRPIIRKTRLVAEGFYDKTKKNIDDLFYKFGIS
jgi:hypothetical protein